jgi:four helix bundle protein
MTDDDAAYEIWARSVPLDIRADTIWRTPAYRLSLYLMSCAQLDIPLILANRATRPHLDQLLRAVGAISADLDEGYSRSSGRERAHYYEYALGSTRESRGWYYKCAVAFPPETLAARLGKLSNIVRILTAIIPRERERDRIEPTRREQPSTAPPLDNPAARRSS